MKTSTACCVSTSLKGWISLATPLAQLNATARRLNERPGNPWATKRVHNGLSICYRHRLKPTFALQQYHMMYQPLNKTPMLPISILSK